MNNLRAPSHTERADFYDLEYAAKLGRLLPVASAKAFEKVLPFNPDDIVSRARLLGHYWKYYGEGATLPNEADGIAGTYSVEDLLANRTEHILWFVHNAPGCIFAGDYYLSCDPTKDEHNYNRVKRAWQAQISERPQCAQTRVNYALFLFQHEKKLAKEILLEILRIEPLNEWGLSLLPLLGHQVELTLPLPIQLAEPPHDEAFVDQRIEKGEKVKSRTLFDTPISNATVETQERILLQDSFDIWARLDILRWCQQQLERANRLEYNPAVLQRWFRHASWILKYVPHLQLRVFYSNDFGFAVTIPATFFEPIEAAFYRAFRESPHKVQVFFNSFELFKRNLGLQEAKKRIFSAQGWKDIDREYRQKLIKDLNSSHERETIFEKGFDLNETSVYADVDLEAPQTMPKVLSTWAIDLHLSSFRSQGSIYGEQSALNLEQLIDSFDADLISTARLGGHYRAHRGSLTQPQARRKHDLSKWAIVNIPECSFACEMMCSSNAQPEVIAELKTLWQRAIATATNNKWVPINAAFSLAYADRSASLRIARQILENGHEDIQAAALIHQLTIKEREIPRLTFYDPSFEAICEKKIESFSTIANEALAKVCDEIHLYIYSSMYSLDIPLLTAWTNNQVLKLNPNDVIVRCEILGRCERDHIRGSFFVMHDPEFARIRTTHLLWLLENVPHADLHFLTNYHAAEGIPSHAKIIAKAIKKQRSVHGKAVAKYRPQYPRKKKTEH